METVAIGPRQGDVWPNRQVITPIEFSICWTLFDDHSTLHDDLVRVALMRKSDEWGDKRAPSHSLDRCKIHHLDTWGSPAVDPIHALEIALFKQAVGSTPAAVDLIWAKVYRQHDCI